MVKLSYEYLSKTDTWFCRAEFSQLNRIHKPTDLGMGFPNFAPPEHLTKALAETTLSESIHQYTRGFVCWVHGNKLE